MSNAHHNPLDDDEVEHIYLGDEPEPHAHGEHHHNLHESIESPEEYRKFRRVIYGILAVSVLLTVVRSLGREWEIERFMADFMAVFFITFAAFKFNDIEGFVIAYRGYDIIAQRIRPWAYAYPFIEAFLGFWYLLSEGPIKLIILTLIITGTAGYSVWKELKKGSKVKCACLGTFIRLPLTKISIVEDALMFAMAAIMLVL